LPVATVLGFGVPALAYVWFVHHYGVNVVYADQWSDVVVLHQLYQGKLSLGTLWVPHNENRTLFPNLLVLLLGPTTHLDTVTETYISTAVLFASTALLILAHRRRSPSTPWILYCPVAWLALSLVQNGDALFGYQLSWYLSLGGLAAAIYLVDRKELTTISLAGAITAAIVASYSSFGGLLVWPSVLLLLWYRRRSRGAILAWLAAAAVTIVVYLYGLDVGQGPSSPNLQFSLRHPLQVVQFFFLVIGDVVGQSFSSTTPDAPHPYVLILGVAIFVVAVAAIAGCRRRAADGGAQPIGVALVGFGLLFAAGTAVSRIHFGLWEAGASRYTLFDLLILVGCYLVVLAPVNAPAGGVAEEGESSRAPSRSLRRVLAGAVAVAVCLQVGLGIPYGLSGGRSMQRTLLLAADVSVNVATAPSDLAYYALYPEGVMSVVYEMLPVERQHHLSLFDDPADVAYYERVGIDSAGTLSPP
jgi:hypothetical protein